MPICRVFAKTGRCEEPNCTFKHSLDEIKECNMYKLGFCIHGSLCRFRHTRLPAPPPDPADVVSNNPRPNPEQQPLQITNGAQQTQSTQGQITYHQGQQGAHQAQGNWQAGGQGATHLPVGAEAGAIVLHTSGGGGGQPAMAADWQAPAMVNTRALPPPKGPTR